VRFLGRVDDADLIPFLGSADVFAMLCRNRWAGLEQEGFGIVFLEAAACGVPVVAGLSGGSAEAVVDGQTGIVVEHPRETSAVVRAIERLLKDAVLARQLGDAGRHRAEVEFTHDRLATLLYQELERIGS
jgi:phosphatidylinositol alpha-1,6-mannosyltransferase